MKNLTDQADAQKNRKAFQSLLDRAGITQARAAELIDEHTKPYGSCKVRTVRAWLADETVGSSRPCPEWAVTALEASLRKHKMISQINEQPEVPPRVDD